MKVVTVISGSGAFFLLSAGAETWATAFSAFVAMWAILDIVISPDKKSEKHSDLASKFTDLAAKLEASEPTENLYRQLCQERLLVEKTEPPVKRLVDIQARNDECRARGFPPEDIAPLTGPQRYLGYFVTFGMEKLEQWKANRQRQLAA
ncbi:MAG TPA: hypothetical protein VGU24_02465 [Microvirga sp.]|jgi:hypothetical protein|nr:hypothetical protein [Microvirga sp.]